MQLIFLLKRNTFNGADANQLEKAIKANDVLKYRNSTIINEMQRRNKDDKISTIVPFVNRGEFVFAEEDEEFIKLFMEFAGQKYSTHDDPNDVAAEFWLRVDEIKTVNKIKLLDRRSLGV